ncbi:hypothetical protein HPP92_012945 [Vanilla planifolia]|uniref:Uncharacterized protein n=1 Tax=Vanilla planifolia TaxID=51239 RepID=A0A835QP21_VANPL|nr:hypothetical protein HPP92_012945 [Vanilla planifolia]
MSTDSSPPALRFHSASTCSDVVREESEADDGSAKSPPKQRMSAKIVGEGIGVGGVECNSSLSGTSGSTSSSLSSTVALSQDKTNKQLDKGSLANWEHGPRESHGSVDQGDRQRRHGGNGRRGSYGNRRDQGGGNQEWNSSRGLGGKGSYLQRGHPRQTVMQPSMPIMMPYIGPPLPLRPFPTPMAFPDFPPQMYYFPTHPYPEFFRGMPFVPPQSTPLVKQLTDNIQFILEAIRTSDVVEVEGNRVRRRDRWSEWIITPHQNQHATEPVYQSRENTNQESLVSRMDNISLGAGNGRANIENPSSLVDRPAP